MAIEVVSLNEINKARELNQNNNSQNSKQIAKAMPAKFFVDKFSDKKIAEFFAPYGYFTHQRDEQSGIVDVLCNDCIIIFDDYSAYANSTNWYDVDDKEKAFDFHTFEVLCEKHNTTPSKAIYDRLETEVFNKMPYYVERKKAHNEELFNEVENSGVYAKLLAPSIQKERLRENFSSLNKNFGSTDPEKIANVLSTLAPKD